MGVKDINVAVIGAGRAGLIHAHNFRKSVPYARLAAVVDPNRAAAERAAKELGVETWYGDYREALRDDGIDAVVVVTPTIYHRDIVVDAARAGKHVLCEKPMAMNAEECEAMIEAAKDAKVNLQIAFMRRFDASFQEAKARLDAGEIGEPVLIRSLTRGPSTPQPWMYDLKKSNGPLAEVNSHDIDTLRWFSGAEFAEVYAIAGNYRCPEAAETYPDFYDNVLLTARFDDGRQGVIDGALSVQYGYDSRVEILGTEGVIFIGQLHEKTIVTARRNKEITRPFMNSWRHLYKDAYLAEDIDFVQSILEQRSPKVTGRDGMMAVKVVEAGNRSIRESAVIRLS
ncbi:oxidoreductase [Paenibacillus antri]|uniref:Oxidoreductase n=1 Tax=Paenibacillus antri TaxID=2582848 RepID=A0A5R9FZV2_9BACL|nr:Gfo/Idh/MocA family oxidoreductase [Paenibacillus antri]TLS49582.1 oxidoreductase [Paenibacillus antri]